MKRLAISLLFISSIIWTCELFAVEEVVNMSYVCRDMKGSIRWRAEAEIKNVGPDVYIMTEKAKGIYSSFTGPISWVAEMKFKRTKDRIIPISLDKRVFDAAGRMIRHEKQEFDLVRNTAICTHEEPLNNVLRTKTFTFNRDVVNRLSLGLYAQKFLESGKTTEKLQMVSEEPNVYNMELKRIGKEAININGREIEAYRLSIDPELGALNMFKALFPRSYAWSSAVPQYERLGYEGLEGGITSEKVRIFIDKL